MSEERSGLATDSRYFPKLIYCFSGGTEAGDHFICFRETVDD